MAGEASERGDETTVFDPTGLAIQDVTAARTDNRRGRKEGVGETFELVGV